MRHLGIDYGSKRVGIALSDEEGRFAMPHSVLQNSKMLLEEVGSIISANDIKTIVIGESKDYKGQDNKIMIQARMFKDELHQLCQIPVVFEPEFLTSHQAQKIQGKNNMLDASAAALILQSYLDRLNQQANPAIDDTFIKR